MDAANVFVSHSSEDGGAVMSLVDDLRRAGINVWLDLALKGGDTWWPTILSNIRACTVFLFAVSENSLNSEPCQAELRYAMDLGLPILPVVLGDVRSYRIDTIFSRQIIDHRTPTAASATALIGGIAELRGYRRQLPEPLPTPPPVPYEYLQRLGEAVNGPHPLAYPQQMELLDQLRQKYRSERDPLAQADIRQLLETLRQRPETSQTTIVDIDALLASDPRNTGPHRLVARPQPRARGPRAAVAILALVLVVTGGIIGGYYLLKPTPVVAPKPPNLEVAWSDDGYGVTVGDPNAPARIELFMEPQCSHCAELDAVYGDDISSRVQAGTLQVTYRPMTFNDEKYPGKYSTRVANALFIASDSNSGTSPKAMISFVAMLWNPPGGTFPDVEGMAQMATTAGLSSEVADRIYANKAVIDLDAMNQANDDSWTKVAPNSPIPIVYDEVSESVVDTVQRNWLDRLATTK